MAILSADGLSRSVARWLLWALCLEVAFSVPYRSVFLAAGSVKLAWIAGIAGLILAGTSYGLRGRVESGFGFLAGWQPGRSWFVVWFALGLAARIGWALVFRSGIRGDGLTYFNEAASLAVHHRYGGAFYPPGLPFFEAPLLMVLGMHLWVAVLFACMMFAVTYAVVRYLSQRLGGVRTAALACMMVAVWPNYISLTATNAKELLLVLLVTLALLLYAKSLEVSESRSAGFLAVAGLLIGCAALTQPAFLLFTAVLGVNELFLRRSWKRVFVHVLLIALASLAAIVPWTYRNYRVFHRPVLISTNGGSVFYRANNPKANAQYAPEGAEVLPRDEFAASEEGYRAARLWIRQHPGDFAALMVRKQVVFLGDDSDGVYESMKRGREPSAMVYGGLKLICSLWWLLLFLFLLPASSWLFQMRNWPLWYGLCVLPMLYQWSIDSVFEAGSRHHNPYLGVLSTLAALAAVSAADRVQGEWKTRPGSVVSRVALKADAEVVSAS